MSLINSAKKFALKNKDKVAAGVDKATDVIDKKTGGKHTDKLRKLDDAAQKFAGKTPAPKPDAAVTPDPAPAADAPHPEPN
jgi:hypothetical protein